jgi:hypothetical protein
VFPVSRSAPKSGNRFSGQADRREMSSTLIQVDWVDVLPCHHRIRCTRESRFILFRPHVAAVAHALALALLAPGRSFACRSPHHSSLRGSFCDHSRERARIRVAKTNQSLPRRVEVSRHSFPVSLNCHPGPCGLKVHHEIRDPKALCASKNEASKAHSLGALLNSDSATRRSAGLCPKDTNARPAQITNAAGPSAQGRG